MGTRRWPATSPTATAMPMAAAAPPATSATSATSATAMPMAAAAPSATVATSATAMPTAAAAASATVASPRVTPSRIPETAGVRRVVAARAAEAHAPLSLRGTHTAPSPRGTRTPPSLQGTRTLASLRATRTPLPHMERNPPTTSGMAERPTAMGDTTQPLTTERPRRHHAGWRWRRCRGRNGRSSRRQRPAGAVLGASLTEPVRGTPVLRSCPSCRSVRSRQTQRHNCCASSSTSRGGCG